jgi:hypothetical protein
MAYVQKPGRGNSAKTGSGIPSPLRQDESIVDTVVKKAKEVGSAISHANKAGKYSYDQSRKSASFAGDFGGGSGGSGRSYSKNPIDYVAGFASDIVSGGKEKTWDSEKKKKSPMKQVVSKKTAYDVKEASNQKLKPSARKHYAENAQAAMKNKKKK